uniref:Uncharacterized protein n=1 Tax=Timema monikensis TaxID=170555 RepID=A0A7R9EM41_9NEOP|nr:unnamed protein product [Timema monikensis]
MCNGNETVDKVKQLSPLCLYPIAAVVTASCVSVQKEHADAELATMVCDTRTPVRRSVVRATVLAAKVTLVMLCAGLVWFFMGWLFLIQLMLVALVAYLAAGRGFRWFYVAFRTLPRDVTPVEYATIVLPLSVHRQLVVQSAVEQRGELERSVACETRTN